MWAENHVYQAFKNKNHCLLKIHKYELSLGTIVDYQIVRCFKGPHQVSIAANNTHSCEK